jgi:hypothetical protein
MATKAKTPVKKSSITKAMVTAHRTRVVKDTSPNWDGCELLTADQFHKNFRNALTYYRLESTVKSFKPFVIKWMTDIGCTKEDIAAMKKVKDSRIGTTMGAVTSCLLRGMPPQRDDFNNGRDSSVWLRAEIVTVLAAGKNDISEEEAKALVAAKPAVYVPSIQERTRDAAYLMTEEIEDAIESFQVAPDSFDPKAFKMLNLLKGKGVKAAHSRIIKNLYSRHLTELEELASGKADDQLKEGYSHRSKKQVKLLIAFYQEIMSACDMLAQEAQVNRAPRAKKLVPAEKIVSKLKFRKSDEPLKLVSINPTDIVGAKELWIYNIKSRKIGRYVAEEFKELSVKGTSILNFDTALSVMKTVRKPLEKLKEFKAAGKVQLRKFLDDITATEARMNGRINEEIILLKVA